MFKNVKVGDTLYYCGYYSPSYSRCRGDGVPQEYNVTKVGKIYITYMVGNHFEKKIRKDGTDHIENGIFLSQEHYGEICLRSQILQRLNSIFAQSWNTTARLKSISTEDLTKALSLLEGNKDG